MVLEQALSRDGHKVRTTESGKTLWDWIEAGEGLIEDQHLRVIDQYAGDFHPLAHAFGELTNGLGSDIAEFDVRQRRDGGGGWVVDSMAPGRHGHHLQRVEMIKQCVLLWDQGEPTAHGAVGARVSTEDLHRAA